MSIKYLDQVMNVAKIIDFQDEDFLFNLVKFLNLSSDVSLNYQLLMSFHFLLISKFTEDSNVDASVELVLTQLQNVLNSSDLTLQISPNRSRNDILGKAFDQDPEFLDGSAQSVELDVSVELETFVSSEDDITLPVQAVDGEMPDMDQVKPAVDGVLPDMDQVKPAVAGVLPDMDQVKPAMDGVLPVQAVEAPCVEDNNHDNALLDDLVGEFDFDFEDDLLMDSIDNSNENSNEISISKPVFETEFVGIETDNSDLGDESRTDQFTEQDIVIDVDCVDVNQSKRVVNIDSLKLTLSNVFKANLDFNRVRNKFYSIIFDLIMKNLYNQKNITSLREIESEINLICNPLESSLHKLYLNILQGFVVDEARLLKAYEKDFDGLKDSLLNNFLVKFNQIFEGVMRLELLTVGFQKFFILRKVNSNKGLRFNGMTLKQIAESEFYDDFYANLANVTNEKGKKIILSSINGDFVSDADLRNLEQNFETYGLRSFKYEIKTTAEDQNLITWSLA